MSNHNKLIRDLQAAPLTTARNPIHKFTKQLHDKLRRERHQGRFFDIKHAALVALSAPLEHWSNIGCHRGQFNFNRVDHDQTYLPGNYFLDTHKANIQERNHRRGLPRRGLDLTGLTPDQKRARRLAQLTQWRADHPNYKREWKAKRKAEGGVHTPPPAEASIQLELPLEYLNRRTLPRNLDQ